MKKGRISEIILKRSVLKQIHKVRKDIVTEYMVGLDGIVYDAGIGRQSVSALESGLLFSDWRAKAILYRAIDDIAAMGGIPSAIQLQLSLPVISEEAVLKKIIYNLEQECAKLSIEIANGRIESADSIDLPVLSIFCIGSRESTCKVSLKNIYPGQDIVILKKIALESTGLLALEHENQLLKHFSKSFVRRSQSLFDSLLVLPEAQVALQYGVTAMHAIHEYGIFGALWEIAEGPKTGLEVNLRKIPIHQETIEICEILEKNPYQLSSAGSLIMVAEKGYVLAEAFKRLGMEAAVIGRITGNKDRILYNNEERRYLEPPR